ncbi:MAG: hypothetical protein B7Y89_17655 [Novosphingobium sp. 32-60-15]|uniref:hypothetical protein n=1 Tax=Novosphingobium sp. 32-60-15 TaxID=1970410 RepID=UPI000BC97101|nr:hypothetical protein [Novosphingobium sp. 32-60-15]OYX59765.1 MAG: hypothetical protein B7Y89_17655 [Novosphingobium sp. 32-60-15]
MSNSYTKAAFSLVVTAAEADLLRRVVAAIEMIGDADIGIDTLEAHHAAIGADFASLFPRTELSPFDGLLDLFPDANYPMLDFDIDFGEPDAAGQVIVFLSGEQFGIETAANLIQRCARSALPFGFEWASDCDRLRAGEFGGGYVVITETAIEYGSTGRMLDRALARVHDEGADGFVLAMRQAEHGLSFWNDAGGFDRLARARIFSEAEAGSFELPVANDEPEWLAMPGPLRL